MYSANSINQITPFDSMTVTSIGTATFLFSDNKLVSKKKYSVVDNYINITDEAENLLNLYVVYSNFDYFEFSTSLAKSDTVLSGYDVFYNFLTGISTKFLMVFVNGYKLNSSQYTVSGATITIHYIDTSTSKSTISIYAASSSTYAGDVTADPTWSQSSQSLTVNGYSTSNYMFFLNGALIPHNLLTLTDSTLTINTPLREGVDVVDYYILPITTDNVLFDVDPGYLSYGTTDKYGVKVPIVYDTVITFKSYVSRLAIDNLRPGFFIREVNGDGCAIVVATTFESKSLECLEISPFSSYEYETTDYFIQVPDATAITKYLSTFDLSGTFFPELLGIFQKTLLDETYDSIQRIKDLRSINRIPTTSAHEMLNFLGLSVDISERSVEEKRALMEELTNFYRIVGTKSSYNYYNVMATTAKIVDMEQLFTPIEDSTDTTDPVYRYVTFRTAEELGALTYRSYDVPSIDYGEVSTIANNGDSLTNTPRHEGVLEDTARLPVLHTPATFYVVSDDNETTTVDMDVPLNLYLSVPTVGPNAATTDYGSVADEAVNFTDFGEVSEAIKGTWNEWTEWDRPTNWYPTNHVNVSVEIPSGVSYDTFMDEFKKTFYKISSAVLYIHSVIDVYIFGNDQMWEEGQNPIFGLMTSQPYHTIKHVFTSNPAQNNVIKQALLYEE